MIFEIFIIGLRGLGFVSAFRLGIQIHKVFCKICVGVWASRVKLFGKGWRVWWAWVWLCVFCKLMCSKGEGLSASSVGLGLGPLPGALADTLTRGWFQRSLGPGFRGLGSTVYRV